MNLRQLECVRALAYHRHFGRAAESIGISQSGLTQNIKNLEAHYGVVLFTRERLAIGPTAFGEVVVSGANQVLERLATVEREIRLLDDLEMGELSVGVDPMLANSLLTPALMALLDRHSKLRFKVSSGGTDELVAKLREREIDLFLGFPDKGLPDSLRSTMFELAAPTVVGRPGHPVLELADRSLLDFLQYPLVQGPIARWYLEWAVEQLSAQDQSVDLLQPYFLQATDVSMLIDIARRSDALFAAMREDVEQYLQNGDLVEIVPPSWPGRVPAGVWYPGNQPLSPAAERLLGEVTRIVERHSTTATN
jgi:DNA-binding transcriptional LysR family regulator